MVSRNPLLVLLTGVLAVLALWFAVTWYRRLAGINPFDPRLVDRWLVGLTPVLCFAIVLIVLRTAADSEVRSSVFYQAMFLVAWALVLTWVL